MRQYYLINKIYLNIVTQKIRKNKEAIFILINNIITE